MQINEVISADPIGDLIASKTASDPIGDLVARFSQASEPTQAVPAPVVKSVPVKGTVKTVNKVVAPVAKLTAKPVDIPTRPGAISWHLVGDYLTSKGLSKPHVIGMLANIEHESGFKPQTLVTDSNGLPSGGLFQHNGPRLQALMNRLGKGWAINWKGQIDFALGEPDGQRYLGAKFADPLQASKWWTMNFERPAQAAKQARKRAATAHKFKR